jgi:RNA recognition motif-containing protein
MKMYIGNLSFDTTKQDLETLFSEYGAVTDVHLPTDRESGRPRGFAFVTMDNKAIAGVDGTDVGGRSLKVNEAQAREERSGGGGGGGGYGGGNRGGGGGGGYGGGGNRGGNDRREERGGGGRRY